MGLLWSCRIIFSLHLTDIEYADALVNTHGEETREAASQPSVQFLAQQQRIDRCASIPTTVTL